MLQPERIIGTMLGGAYVSQGLYSLAERQFQKVVELNPDTRRHWLSTNAGLRFNVKKSPGWMRRPAYEPFC